MQDSWGTIGSWRANLALTVITVDGELDIATLDRFADELLVARSSGHEIVVDLSRATFVDVAPFGVLVTAQHLLAQDGRRLVVVTGLDRSPLARLSEVLGATFETFPELQPALAALAPAPVAPPTALALDERLEDAVLHEVAAVGREQASVNRVVARADCTRAEFHDRFASLPDCFRTALRTRFGDQPRVWREALEAPGAPLDGPRRAVQQYFTRLSEDSVASACFLLHNPWRSGKGAVRVARRRHALGDALRQRLGTEDGATCSAFVATVPAVAADYVALDRVDALDELVGPLLRPLATLAT